MRLTVLNYACFGVLVLSLTFCGGCGSAYSSGSPDPPPPPPSSSVGSLYTMSNASSGNTIFAFMRNWDGTLQQVASYATGGLGVGHGLENQGALAISDDQKYLFVVNPGSDDVSAFEITQQGLKLTARTSSGGRFPVSVAERAGLVYVLNRGSAVGDPAGDNISGLRLEADGSLTPINGSTASLSTLSTDAAQIGFNPTGSLLVVSEHGAGPIDTFTVGANGIPIGHLIQPSAGRGPFGFAFRNSSQLYVSEATSGSASSYSVGAEGTIKKKRKTVPNTQ